MTAAGKFLVLLALLAGPLQAGAAPRVVSLAPSVTELVCAIGCRGMLAGRSSRSDRPAEVAALPDVGPYFRPSAERILLLKPDLCIGVRDGTPPSLVEKLGQCGVRVELVEASSLGGLALAAKKLGRMLGAEEGAGQLARRMEQAAASVRARVPSGVRPPRVLFLVQESPLIAASEETFIGSLVRDAGGTNVVGAGGGRQYPVLGREEVFRLAPDVILLAGAAADGPQAPPAARASSGPAARGGKSAGAERDAAEAWGRPPAWKPSPRLAALAPGARGCVVDADSFSRPSPGSIGALELLAALLYPPHP